MELATALRGPRGKPAPGVFLRGMASVDFATPRVQTYEIIWRGKPASGGFIIRRDNDSHITNSF